MSIHDYPPSALSPHYLDAGEQEVPITVLEALFDFAHLPSLRRMLWNWLSITIKGSYNKKDCDLRQRDSIVLCYEKMLKLVEACWLLVKKNELSNQEHIINNTTIASSPVLNEEIEAFFRAHPPARLLSTLRLVLLDDIGSEFETAVPLNLKTMMWDFSGLFQLLEKAVKHYPSS